MLSARYIVLFVAGLGLILFTAFAPAATADAFTVEDGPVELASALFWLAAAALAFRRARRTRLREEALTWLFVLGCFVMFGEEISWGQRQLGLTTPEALRELNYQQEINLHNLRILTPEELSWKEALRTGQFSWGLLLNADKLFALAFLGYFFVLPWLYRRAAALHRWLDAVGFFSPTVGWIATTGSALALSYGLVLVTGGHERQHSISEARELLFAAAVLVYTLDWLGRPPKSAPGT